MLRLGVSLAVRGEVNNGVSLIEGGENRFSKLLLTGFRPLRFTRRLKKDWISLDSMAKIAKCFNENFCSVPLISLDRVTVVDEAHERLAIDKMKLRLRVIVASVERASLCRTKLRRGCFEK